MIDLGQAYSFAGNLSHAKKTLQEALLVSRTHVGQKSKVTVEAMSSFANVLQQLGEMNLAKKQLEEAYTTAQELLRTQHLTTLAIMNDLGLIYLESNQLSRAQSLIKESLQKTELTLGRDHPSYLSSLNNLADLYRRKGNYDEAAKLYEICYPKMTKILGKTHPDRLTCANNLATTYLEMDRAKLAIPIFNETLDLQKEIFRTDHPDTLLTMNNLAKAYFVLGKLNLALPLLEDAYLNQKATLGAQHVATKNSFKGLSLVYSLMANSPREWLGFFEREYESRRKLMSTSSPKFLMIASGLGMAHSQARNTNDSWKMLSMVQTQRQKNPLASRVSLELAKLLLQNQESKSRADIKGRLTGESIQGVHDVKLSAGRFYVIDMISADFDTLLRLEEIDGKQLAENDDIEERNLNSRIVFFPPADGKYRIVATSYRNQGQGNYEIIIRDLTNAKPELVKGESPKGGQKVNPKDEKSNPLAQAITGQLTKDDPLDRFPLTEKSFASVHEVEFKKGETFQIDLKAKFDPYLRIESANKVALLDNDDASPPGTLDSRLIFSPKEDGKYRVIATSFKPGETGDYEITITPVQISTFSKTFKETLVKTPQTIKGKFFKLHKVELEADTPYTIHLRSQKFDTFLRLGDDNARKVVAQNDDVVPGNTKESRIDFTPSRTGSYTIVVTSFAPGETGDYELTVQGYEPKKE